MSCRAKFITNVAADVRRVVNRGLVDDLFPLTPALSLGERETPGSPMPLLIFPIDIKAGFRVGKI
jgi:hypothetical protein